MPGNSNSRQQWYSPVQNGGVISPTSDRNFSPAQDRNREQRSRNQYSGDDRRYTDYKNSNGDYRNGRGYESDYEDRYRERRGGPQVDRYSDNRRRSYADGPRYFS